MTLIIQNFLLFQVGWLACVLGGASPNNTWVGVVLVCGIIAVHLFKANDARPELQLVMVTVLLGTVWDSLLTTLGLYEFANGVFVAGFAPYWIIAMWALFATTLNVSMTWMKGRYLLAAIVGLIGGPLAYYAGHKLGAVNFSNTMMTLTVVGAGWFFIMPLLVYFSEKFNGYVAVGTVKLEATQA